jgi:hypothetical protein
MQEANEALVLDGEEYLRIVFDPVIRPLLLQAVEVNVDMP